MPSVVIYGNKPIGPAGENDQFPQEVSDFNSASPFYMQLVTICQQYQNRHGVCSSLSITIVDPPHPALG